MSKSDVKPIQANISLCDWEETMVDDLCRQYNLPDSVILNIGVTFLMNEISASQNGKQSLLNSISKVEGKNA